MCLCVCSVQKQTIPALLAGRDAVVRSQTGSGETPQFTALLHEPQNIHLFSSADVCVCVSSVSAGKTLSYAVPVVQSLQAVQPKVSRSDGPLAVVIVPTREVCLG